jgi:hypothetical protein
MEVNPLQGVGGGRRQCARKHSIQGDALTVKITAGINRNVPETHRVRPSCWSLEPVQAEACEYSRSWTKQRFEPLDKSQLTLRPRTPTGTLLAFKLTARTSLLLVSSNTCSVPASAMQYELDEMGIPNNYADGDHSVDQKAHWNRQREQVMVRKLREKQRNCGTSGRCLRI